MVCRYDAFGGECMKHYIVLCCSLYVIKCQNDSFSDCFCQLKAVFQKFAVLIFLDSGLVAWSIISLPKSYSWYKKRAQNLSGCIVCIYLVSIRYMELLWIWRFVDYTKATTLSLNSMTFIIWLLKEINLWETTMDILNRFHGKKRSIRVPSPGVLPQACSL